MYDNIVAVLRLIKTTPLTKPLSMLTDHTIIYIQLKQMKSNTFCWKGVPKRSEASST